LAFLPRAASRVRGTRRSQVPHRRLRCDGGRLTDDQMWAGLEPATRDYDLKFKPPPIDILSALPYRNAGQTGRSRDNTQRNFRGATGWRISIGSWSRTSSRTPCPGVRGDRRA